MREAVSTPWTGSAHPHVGAIEIVREGDRSGYGAVVRFTLQGGREIAAIALPHRFPSRMGPTWAYLLHCHGWSLIDAGPQGALDALENGLGVLGLRLSDLERVIVTHGHQDHDGNAYDLARASGAELWAHEMYLPFLAHDSYHPGLDSASPLHRELWQMERDGSGRQDSTRSAQWRAHNQRYVEERRKLLEEGLPIHAVRDGEQMGDMGFLYTPGHAVDGLCISYWGVVLTGDHILPQVAPHPSLQRTYPEHLLDAIPPAYRRSSDHYGLASYLRSLGRVLALDIDTTVLPAHRLLSYGRLNLPDLRRAQEIARHQVRRLEGVLGNIGEEAVTVTEVTARMFPARRLAGSGLFAAMSEVVSCLELLADTGDVRVSEDGRVWRSGTESFYREVEALASSPIAG